MTTETETGITGLRLCNDNGRCCLLNDDGMPTNHRLAPEHANHILRVSRSFRDNVEAAFIRWDYYATASGNALRAEVSP